MPVGKRNLVRVEVGQRFGRGVVIDPEIRVRRGQQTFRGVKLLCDCGNTYTTAIHQLVGADGPRLITKSCGCLNRETRSQAAREMGLRNARHGMHDHPLYNTWRGILNRCYKPDSAKYHRYGARGITVHDSWHDMSNFAAWIEANLGSRPDGMTLDRIDNDGNYEPGNVRWASPSEQTANREYAIALSFLAWAKLHHPDVVAAFGTRIGRHL